MVTECLARDSQPSGYLSLAMALSDEILDPTTCNDQGRVKVATNNAELIHLSSQGVEPWHRSHTFILPGTKCYTMTEGAPLVRLKSPQW